MSIYAHITHGERTEAALDLKEAQDAFDKAEAKLRDWEQREHEERLLRVALAHYVTKSYDWGTA